MITLDKFAFEKRGGFGCSNSDYEVQTTSCCHRHVVRDDELDDIYFDPDNLTKAIRLWEQDKSRCPLCGAREWRIEELDDKAQVPAEWAWARLT